MLIKFNKNCANLESLNKTINCLPDIADIINIPPAKLVVCGEKVEEKATTKGDGFFGSNRDAIRYNAQAQSYA